MNNEDNGTKVETLDTLNKTLWFIPKSHGENYKWSVAIDFGTCMSGFAYSTSEEFNNSPLLIFHKQCWNEESTNRNTMKTATCLLLNSNKELVAFGFDAQAKFAGLQLEDKHTQYYYFHNFKMAVYNQQKSLKGLQIIDIQDKRVAVRDVFVESIKAIKQEVLKTLALQYNDVNEKNIRWVLTVPAIWPDDAKLFMRECAQEAKLPWEQLLIALEPEAASIYCQFLAINKERNLSDGFQITDIGTKYMILDVGG
ncbi:heat shock 70 kDa protein 12A-like [Mytilus galloprovincialis]|uniref:heat shock 70 kDa protein 12A-like n=1 Tax=Mytilus galloprovincialis TaxID=29158 RepID=UPI003F7BA1E7